MTRDFDQQRRDVLGGVPGYCRAIDRSGTFICALPVEHDGDHNGVEMPTVTIDDPEWDQ